MDEKLVTLAKSTVFARCTRRELLDLGRLFEVVRLAPGTTLRAGAGRWLHVVLDGAALAVTGGQLHGLLGGGAIWPPEGCHPDDHLVALGELTVATVAARSLAAVARGRPDVDSLPPRPGSEKAPVEAVATAKTTAERQAGTAGPAPRRGLAEVGSHD
jgi:hypothetical protein